VTWARQRSILHSHEETETKSSYHETRVSRMSRFHFVVDNECSPSMVHRYVCRNGVFIDYSKEFHFLMVFCCSCQKGSQSVSILII
jgi:hypothetical protein